MKIKIITHLAGQTYVWHGCKGPQIYLQPAKIKSQHFGVSLKFLVWNWKFCIWRLNVCQNFLFQVCLHRTTSVRNIRISDCIHTKMYSQNHSFSQCILLSWSKLTKMSDNSNNVHFSSVRLICSPYLAIKSALASLGPIMAGCGPQMNLTPSKWTLLSYCGPHLMMLSLKDNRNCI